MPIEDLPDDVRKEGLIKKILELYALIQGDEIRQNQAADSSERFLISKKMAEIWEDIRKEFSALRALGRGVPPEVWDIAGRAPWAARVSPFKDRTESDSSPIGAGRPGTPLSGAGHGKSEGTGELRYRRGNPSRRLIRSGSLLARLRRRPDRVKGPRRGPVPNQPVKLRLDAAVPEQVTLGKPFELAVAVRLAASDPLREADLSRVRSAEMTASWPDDAPFLRLRLEVICPSCGVGRPASRAVRLDPGRDSPVFYFHLTPRHTGEISIVVNAYQRRTALGSARLLTRVQEHVTGTVKLRLVSREFDELAAPAKPPSALVYAANVFLGIVVLGLAAKLVSGIVAGQLSRRLLLLTIPLGLAAGLALILINFNPWKRKGPSASRTARP